MKAGPKADPNPEPLDLRHLPKQRAARCMAFIERFLKVPSGFGAGKPFKLLPWEREVIKGVFAPGIMTALISLPRGNGKSGLASAIGLFGLFADGQEGARVLTVASTENQAAIIFNDARRMVELNPALLSRVQVFQRQLAIPATDAVFQPLPAAARSLQGQRPSLCIIDELAVVHRDTFESMSLALGKKKNSLLISISTSPVEEDSVMHSLRELGLDGGDPSFYFREWSAPAGCDITDERYWEISNPSLDVLLSRDALRSDLKKVRESSFRRFRLNQTVNDEDAWLEPGVWAGLADASRSIPLGARLVAGFDGSTSGDATALVIATVEETPRVALAALWERPDGVEGWKVSRQEVTATIEALYRKYDVVELACDPAWWRDTIEQWAHRFPNVVEIPSWSVARMGPATDKVYAAIAEGRLSHDGDPRLAKHVANCVVRQTMAGAVVQKDGRTSPRRIDAAIAMILAVDRALWHVHQAKPRRRVFVG